MSWTYKVVGKLSARGLAALADIAVCVYVQCVLPRRQPGDVDGHLDVAVVGQLLEGYHAGCAC